MRTKTKPTPKQIYPDTVDITDVKPEAFGWQTIGNGAYHFAVLLNCHGAEPFGMMGEMPPNFEELSEREFATKTEYHSLPFIATTYRQILADQDGLQLATPIEGHLFINHLGKGFMLSMDYFKRKVRYYIFEFCIHDYITLKTNGLGSVTRKCVKCDYIHDT